MNIFILCTGRCGSKSIVEACHYIENFTSGHETRSQLLLDERLNYPKNHIEADNRLSWFLGELDLKYGNNAKYVHLIREEEATVNSLNQRWRKNGIVTSFAEGIHKLNTKNKQIVKSYYRTVNSNIDHFLKDKSEVLIMRTENMTEDFENFWNFIEAKGDLEKAKKSFSEVKNSGKDDVKLFSRLNRFIFTIKHYR